MDKEKENVYFVIRRIEPGEEKDPSVTYQENTALLYTGHGCAF